MAIFLEICIEVIPHVYKHDLMEVSFSAVSQGCQNTQADFPRNLLVYFYDPLFLNADSLSDKMWYA